MVDACRALRGEMGVPPARRLPLVAAGDAARLAEFAPYLRALARLEAVEIVADLPSGSVAPVQLVGEARLMLKIGIDVATERQRIDREIARVESELRKAEARLGSTSCVERAPAAVVEQERGRSAAFGATLERLREQRARLDQEDG